MFENMFTSETLSIILELFLTFKAPWWVYVAILLWLGILTLLMKAVFLLIKGEPTKRCSLKSYVVHYNHKLTGRIITVMHVQADDKDDAVKQAEQYQRRSAYLRNQNLTITIHD